MRKKVIAECKPNSPTSSSWDVKLYNPVSFVFSHVSLELSLFLLLRPWVRYVISNTTNNEGGQFQGFAVITLVKFAETTGVHEADYAHSIWSTWQ